MTQRMWGISYWQLGLGILAVVTGVYAYNALSQPGLTEAERKALSHSLLGSELLDPAYKGNLVCDRYATQIAYLSECQRMFADGTEGPCPARAGPQNMAVPTSGDGLANKISDLEVLVEQDCNAPLSELMLRISKDPIR
ncbi:MAG: hypothetical protein AAFY82_02665 [Pseudomonadota bacterium]